MKWRSSLGANPRLKKLSLQQRKNLVEFISGNMLFAMLHELAHTAIADLDLPVLGREEDAADNFAVLRLLHVGSDLSHRVLVEAAKGWFLSDRRDREEGEKPVLFDNHGLDQQRAYQIVCLMVGSDPNDFTDLADETKLPNYRQEVAKRTTQRRSRPGTRYSGPMCASRTSKKPISMLLMATAKAILMDTRKRFATCDYWKPLPSILKTNRLAGAIHVGDAELRLHQRPMDQPGSQIAAVLRTRSRFADLYRDFNEVPKATKRTARRSSARANWRPRSFKGLGRPALG